ncbi:MAG: DPP IV N-terminal domain-containing protein, partial [Bacteroidota bacterium]
WVLNLANNSLQQLGKERPESSLMFAKFSPNGEKVAYVSERNVYVEDLENGKIKALTSTNNTPKLINGTFDWAYEEEFKCLDGFRWSPDGSRIAYWQIDANKIRDFYMINTTDSIYAYTIPVEYPKVGESPSACRVGVVDIENGKTKWMTVPGDEQQNYIPRMDWADNDQLILQQLNRKQNESRLYFANAKTGVARLIYEEQEEAWISIRTAWEDDNMWKWIEGGKSFLWITEKDGWRHVYAVSRDGKKETLITKGNYDMIRPVLVNEKDGFLYFMASPDQSTESYLYRTPLNGKGKAERLTPANQEGTHSYELTPDAKFAVHNFSNYYTRPMREQISLPDHQSLDGDNGIAKQFDPSEKAKSNVSYFSVTTEDGVEMDGWMAKPKNFDPTKKYPTVFYVYSEPAGMTTTNRFGVGYNRLYDGDMAEDGYVYISLDNRGTPAPKGKEWRKSIYRKIGIVNIRDQAMACKKVIETYPFVDTDRIAVHGWSGGGSATLNLLFQYPDLYQTGISVAAVANQLTYDNIYQERYMGIPQENREDFINGSPVTYAKNLEGNLLYIHGTGDDNVHYQNAEILINELIKHNKQFQFMPYPNRSHGIREGEGTQRHLRTLFTNFLRQHCPPGAR